MVSLDHVHQSRKPVFIGLSAIILLSLVGIISDGRSGRNLRAKAIVEARFQLERTRNLIRRWNCPVGQYAAGTQKSKVLCSKCDPGYRCSGGFKPRKPCKAGRYQKHAGQSSCIPCKANTFQSSTGQTKCSPCPSGKTSGIGATKCSSPPRGACLCPRILSPVCGKDGKTYPNACELACKKQRPACKGRCPCQERCACPKIYDPVCGMDSKTYANTCLAQCAKQIISCKGKCPCVTSPGRPYITRRPTSRPISMLRFKTFDGKKAIRNIPNSKKYFYVKERMNWKSAEDFCERKGSQLAVIHSITEHRFVSNTCQDECWIGADRGSLTDGFGWTDESKIDFENWVPGEPKTGKCVQMENHPEHRWIGTDCERQLPFVCQNNNHFQLKLAVVDDSVLGNQFIGKHKDIIWLIIFGILLTAFFGVQFVHDSRKRDAKMKEEEDEEVLIVDENTPLIPNTVVS